MLCTSWCAHGAARRPYVQCQSGEGGRWAGGEGTKGGGFIGIQMVGNLVHRGLATALVKMQNQVGGCSEQWVGRGDVRGVCALLPSVTATIRLLVGSPFVINSGLWPSAPIPVGNVTLVVTERVYV